ncbi:MAG: hypothetical protein ACLFR0_01965 [Alphaproteobacteria bacterium]
MRNAFIKTSLASAFLSASFITPTQATPHLTQEQWDFIQERYGEHEGTPLYSSEDGPSSCADILDRLSDGIVYQKDFSKGRGRLSIGVESPGNDNGISVQLQFGTRGHSLPDPAC